MALQGGGLAAGAFQLRLHALAGNRLRALLKIGNHGFNPRAVAPRIRRVQPCHPMLAALAVGFVDGPVRVQAHCRFAELLADVVRQLDTRRHTFRLRRLHPGAGRLGLYTGFRRRRLQTFIQGFNRCPSFPQFGVEFVQT